MTAAEMWPEYDEWERGFVLKMRGFDPRREDDVDIAARINQTISKIVAELLLLDRRALPVSCACDGAHSQVMDVLSWMYFNSDVIRLRMDELRGSWSSALKRTLMESKLARTIQ